MIQRFCEETDSGRVLSAPVLPIFTGVARLLTVLIGIITGGPPRFHAVGPNPAVYDQFNFIVLLLSLMLVLIR